MNCGNSKIKIMFCIQCIIKICPAINLVNIKIEFKCINRIEITADCKLVMINTAGKNSGKSITKVMLPFNVCITVTVSVQRITVKPETIAAYISAYINIIVGIDLMTDDKVCICEGCSTVIQHVVVNAAQQPVRIGCSCT